MATLVIRMVVLALSLVLWVAPRVAADEGCGIQRHYDLLAGNPEAQKCISGFTIHIDRNEQIDQVVTRRRKFRETNVPAVCIYPIPCNFQNARRDVTITNETQYTVSVTGTATISAKASLGETLLGLIGLNVAVEIGISGNISFTWRTSDSDTLRVVQDDCLSQRWDWYRTTSRVRGKVTEVEVYTWTLHSYWMHGPCPGGTVQTRCDLGSASGSAYSMVSTDLEYFIWPCCEPLNPPSPETPCCARECPH